MYKNKSQKEQSKLVRPVGKNLPSYEENLKGEDLRSCLVKKYKSLEDELEKYPKGSMHRKQIGHEKNEIATQINKIRPKYKRDVSSFFVDVCKSEMIDIEFKRIIRKAQKMYDDFLKLNFPDIGI